MAFFAFVEAGFSDFVPRLKCLLTVGSLVSSIESDDQVYVKLCLAFFLSLLVLLLAMLNDNTEFDLTLLLVGAYNLTGKYLISSFKNLIFIDL